MQATEETTYSHAAGRISDVGQLIDAHEHDRPAPDDLGGNEDAMDALYEYPLSVETETVYRIVLGTGGPHDEFRIRVQDGEIVAIEYGYYWSGMPGHGDETISLDSPDGRTVEQFARLLIPELE